MKRVGNAPALVIALLLVSACGSAVVGSTAGPRSTARAVSPHAVTTATALPAVTDPVAYVTSGPGSTSWLRSARWSALPPAPIAPRLGATVMWTGSELLVWGGVESKQHYAADGASYDPVTSRWQVLPPSPLSARDNARAVWTGAALIVWGGWDGGNTALSDGASFDPATRHWTPIAPSPLTGADAMVAVGADVFLLGGPRRDAPAAPRSDGRPDVATFDVARYDTAAHTWSLASAPPALASYDAVYTQAVTVGDTIVVLVQSQTIESVTLPTETDTTYTPHKQAFLYDTHADRWTVLDGAGQPDVVGQPIWTGREVLVPPAGEWCGPHSCPSPHDTVGARLELGESTWRAVQHGAYDGTGRATVWTGAALVRTTDAYGHARAVEAWGAATGAWTQLAPAPGDVADTDAVWTGHELLYWGSTADGAEQGFRLG